MNPIKVLVVDDSQFIREAVTTLLSMDDGIKVVGEGVNGVDALEKVRDLKPDLITLDIEMPVMDGLEAIERIMCSYPLPILVLTSFDDAHTAYTAISKGALEVLPKPELDSKKAKEFINNIKLLSKVKVISHIRGSHLQKGIVKEFPARKETEKSSERIIAVAASTGGPNALSQLLSKLPEKFPCPFVVAQHIQEAFIPGLVKWLDSISVLSVKQADEGEQVKPGFVYISPAEKHMEIDREKRIVFIERRPYDIHFPSCNRLLSSVARVYGTRSIGIILSGMGSDGVLGMKDIKSVGGTTIAQDEKSSIIFGMPMEAIKNGCIEKVLHLDRISSEIVELARRSIA